MRVNLSVAIVYMVNNTAISGEGSSSDGQGDKDGPFAWDEAQQGIILGMFFYGYVVTQVRVVLQHFEFTQIRNCHQVPGGRMAEIVGGKWLFGVGNVFNLILEFRSFLELLSLNWSSYLSQVF